MEAIATLVAWMIVFVIIGTPAVILGNCLYEKIRRK